MNKRHQIEHQFNKTLKKHEYLLKFHGDNEVIITGAPTNNLLSRLLFSLVGIILVTLCLINADSSANTFIIGGCLLGLIMAGTPFISFYDKKYFKIYISRRLKQITVDKGVSNPYQRIDFSSIDHIILKRVDLADMVSNEAITPMIHNYTFAVSSEGRETDLFSISSSEDAINTFALKFAQFMGNLTGKELKAQV